MGTEQQLVLASFYYIRFCAECFEEIISFNSVPHQNLPPLLTIEVLGYRVQHCPCHMANRDRTGLLTPAHPRAQALPPPEGHQGQGVSTLQAESLVLAMAHPWSQPQLSISQSTISALRKGLSVI